jgi:hypothetical protein
VIPNLDKNNKYNLLYPNYTEKEAFRKGIPHVGLQGYPIIFQNMGKEFKELLKDSFISKYFKDKSSLIRL